MPLTFQCILVPPRREGMHAITALFKEVSILLFRRAGMATCHLYFKFAQSKEGTKVEASSDRPTSVEQVFEELSAILNGGAVVEDRIKYPLNSGSEGAPEPLLVEGMQYKAPTSALLIALLSYSQKQPGTSSVIF